jgi:hypothetical protein
VHTIERRRQCVEPGISALITPYCFGDLAEEGRATLEAHLLLCDACWNEVLTLKPAVQALRSDRGLEATVTPQDVAGLLGLSAAIDRPLAGHRAHVLVWAMLYALLFAVPVFVEVAYRWDVYGGLAWMLGPPTFLWMALATLGALQVQANGTRHRTFSPARSLTLLVGAAAMLSAVVVGCFRPRRPWTPRFRPTRRTLAISPRPAR